MSGVTSAAANAAAHPARSCSALTKLSLPDTEITAARNVPRGDYKAPDGKTYRDLPAFCRVTARIAPSLTFEVWLPATSWNRRLQGVGNGGFAGQISYSAMAPALTAGYAAVSTDTGHSASDTANSWISDPARLRMWGRTSIHLMTVRAKEILAERYGAGPKYSYFVGGSTGGRQGMIEAQYYPDDYDGIVSKSPGMDYSHVMMAVLWASQHLAEHPDGALDEDSRKLLGDAVLEACAGRDGVPGDPFLNDPRDCGFPLERLRCKGDRSDGCLTAAQIATAERIYAPVSNPRTGEQLYPGFSYGSESAWHYAAEDPQLVSYPQALFGRAVFHDANWDWRTFDFDKDAALVEKKLAPGIDATRTDLSRFAARGGKLIMTQGWSDDYQAATLPIEYYHQVLLDHGGSDARSSLRGVQQFYRLFMVPGGGHVTGGPGPNSFDALSAVRNWVERGIAPKKMVATKYVADRPENGVSMTRPLCPYPQVARYDGSGPASEAGNFRCADDWADFAADVARQQQR
ncbi:tannase/feruloyl esterase family alpha/beta hydrolase [Streptomyces sp. NPDC102360]|uniref:tannase/feruloyl esterase family alpha/beta hydrolase n=1 Tax=Streptomyces sp. NPDC102360 TaxID=3366160 RepID=UPI00380BD1DC